MTISKLEATLQQALERQRAIQNPPGELEEFSAAREAVLAAERALAHAKGEQYAVPIDFPVRWDIGAPLPHLLQSDDRTFVAFFLCDVDPNWDGSYTTIRYPDNPAA